MEEEEEGDWGRLPVLMLLPPTPARRAVDGRGQGPWRPGAFIASGAKGRRGTMRERKGKNMSTTTVTTATTSTPCQKWGLVDDEKWG